MARSAECGPDAIEQMTLRIAGSARRHGDRNDHNYLDYSEELESQALARPQRELSDADELRIGDHVEECGKTMADDSDPTPGGRTFADICSRGYTCVALEPLAERARCQREHLPMSVIH